MAPPKRSTRRQPKLVPKGARVVVVGQHTKVRFTASRAGRIAEGTRMDAAEQLLARMSLKKAVRAFNDWSKTVFLVDAKGKVLLAMQGGKRGGKNKTSKKIAKVARTTRGKVRLTRRRQDGRIQHTKSATRSAMALWKTMPLGTDVDFKGSDKKVFKPRYSTEALLKRKRRTSRK